jgi:hypothetical protein
MKVERWPKSSQVPPRKLNSPINSESSENSTFTARTLNFGKSVANFAGSG